MLGETKEIFVEQPAKSIKYATPGGKLRGGQQKWRLEERKLFVVFTEERQRGRADRPPGSEKVSY